MTPKFAGNDMFFDIEDYDDQEYTFDNLLKNSSQTNKLLFEYKWYKENKTVVYILHYNLRDSKDG